MIIKFINIKKILFKNITKIINNFEMNLYYLIDKILDDKFKISLVTMIK